MRFSVDGVNGASWCWRRRFARTRKWGPFFDIGQVNCPGPTHMSTGHCPGLLLISHPLPLNETLAGGGEREDGGAPPLSDISTKY